MRFLEEKLIFRTLRAAQSCISRSRVTEICPNVSFVAEVFLLDLPRLQSATGTQLTVLLPSWPTSTPLPRREEDHSCNPGADGFISHHLLLFAAFISDSFIFACSISGGAFVGEGTRVTLINGLHNIPAGGSIHINPGPLAAVKDFGQTHHAIS